MGSESKSSGSLPDAGVEQRSVREDVLPIASHDAREHASEDIHRGAPRVDQPLRLREQRDLMRSTQTLGSGIGQRGSFQRIDSGSSREPRDLDGARGVEPRRSRSLARALTVHEEACRLPGAFEQRTDRLEQHVRRNAKLGACAAEQCHRVLLHRGLLSFRCASENGKKRRGAVNVNLRARPC